MCFHTSQTCNTPAKGHQANATANNCMGENNHNCNLIINNSNHTFYPYIKYNILPTYTIAKADSGASNYYWRQSDITSLQHLRNNMTGLRVRLPNNEITQSTQTGNLNLNNCSLSKSGTKAHVLPHLKNASLISLEQLADDNCVTVLDKHEINIYKKVDPTHSEEQYNKHIQPKNKILTSLRNTSNGL